MGIISSVHAVMSTRTSQGTIAWLVCLLTFPYLAVPAYWVLGRNKFNGYVTARRSASGRLRPLVAEAGLSIAPFRLPEGESMDSVRAAAALARLPVLSGNDVELLMDGEACFDDILSGVRRAKNYVLFQFFIIRDDGLGRRVKTTLMEKVAEGVPIYFIYDEIGCHALPEAYLLELREAGVEVAAFNTRKGKGNRFQINFRNHRKTVIVDGDSAWLGGHNVGDEYLGKSRRFGHWRDTHMRIDGPAALAVQLSFVEDWHWATGSIPALNWQPAAGARGDDARVLVIPSGPADSLETANLLFVHAINSAQERIWIASPYFVPDESIVTALQLAGLRGVDVRVLIPNKPDHLLVYLAAFAYIDQSSETGVQFYRYTHGFLHEKVTLIDSSIATVGTANLDNRSFRLNFEITAAVADEPFIASVEQMFIDDFSQSELMKKNTLANKPWWFRFVVRLAKLAAPVQ